MSVLAIITARGGSKRIPKKNIKSFNGKPIIAYTIQAALKAGIFDEVMVSTDDNEIAEVSKSFGAAIPFFRSRQNSDDFATTGDVLREVLTEYAAMSKKFIYACCIYPTAPFVTSEKLRLALNQLKSSGADTLLPVVKFDFPILRAMKMNRAGRITYVWPEFASKRSQDLEVAYHDCGQFYFFNVNRFLESGQLITKNTIGLEVSSMEVQDIDTEEDWKLAERKYLLLKQEGVV